ncbi:MAG: NAD(P)-binding domain-containing protein [Pseudomonadota bacterium]
MANYTVLGAGRLGGTLARCLAGLGHQIQVVVPTPKDPKYQDLASVEGISMTSSVTPDRVGDLMFVATPWEVTEKALGDYDVPDGQVIVDCTNPVSYGATGMSLVIDANTSAAELIQGWLPATKVVKTLNQVGSDILADPAALAPTPMIGVAADDNAAKSRVSGVLADLGVDAFDAGGLENARLLEAFALLWMSQAFTSGDPGAFAFGKATRV